MSRHLDGSPKPADPLWPRRWEWLHLSCRCGHRAALHIGALAPRHEPPLEARLRRVVERLRCRLCGAAPAGAEVRPRRR